jgi:hypothetical protein
MEDMTMCGGLSCWGVMLDGAMSIRAQSHFAFTRYFPIRYRMPERKNALNVNDEIKFPRTIAFATPCFNSHIMEPSQSGNSNQFAVDRGKYLTWRLTWRLPR